jgi:hypothetical protein
MNKNCILAFVIFASPSVAVDPNASKQSAIQYLRSYRGVRTFLLSYPRSGNTWLRYICERTAHCPTFMRGLYKEIDQPLAWSTGFDDIDLSKPPIEKAHLRRELNGSYHPGNRLILLIRNPKEVLTRVAHKPITVQVLLGTAPSNYVKGSDYFDLISVYDSWDPNKRLLVYYEDLLTNPRKEITRILNFLNEPLTALNDFIRDYQKHKKICLDLYKDGESKGEDLLFHSKNIDPAYRLLIDQWINNLYPVWWNNYLKQHYAEEVLDYQNSRIVKIDWEDGIYAEYFE